MFFISRYYVANATTLILEGGSQPMYLNSVDVYGGILIGNRIKWDKFDPWSNHVGFVVDKVALGQVFPLVLRFSLSISFHRCSITCKNEKEMILFLFIFITGLHNKP
jgi:hypothetical protein